MSRVILHSDLNCFYASVETVLHPELEGKAVAVCGSQSDRHGIVLAKSELAKRAGVKTGMVIWEAKQRCPNLIVVEPHYESYLKFSGLVKEIYYRYTDLVEPFGMDENWLDITGCIPCGMTARDIADEIRETVHTELGLTVSVGVSFNKVFAKLGSDMKKPDATTEITEQNFRDKVWKLPVSDLLYVGRASMQKMAALGIATIGDLAQSDEALLRKVFGINGTMLWLFANGMDNARVMHRDQTIPLKSVGHGITCNANLVSDDEVRQVMLELSQDVGYRLASNGLLACGVQIEIKDNSLHCDQFMSQLPFPTRSRRIIADAAYRLYREKYEMQRSVRAVTVRAIKPVGMAKCTRQMSFFVDEDSLDRLCRIEATVDELCDRFGRHTVVPAEILANPKTKSELSYLSIMPHGMVK